MTGNVSGTAATVTGAAQTAITSVGTLGSLAVSGTINTSNGILELGLGRVSNGFAYVDLVGDTTYTDYGLRLLRGNTGENANSQLNHRGTGTLSITTQEAAPIIFSTTSIARMRITADGNVGIGVTVPTEKLDVAGNIALTGSVVFEGATANNFETTLSVTDPTAARTITLPDASGTVATTTNVRDTMMKFIMEVI